MSIQPGNVAEYHREVFGIYVVHLSCSRRGSLFCTIYRLGIDLQFPRDFHSFHACPRISIMRPSRAFIFSRLAIADL